MSKMKKNSVKILSLFLMLFISSQAHASIESALKAAIQQAGYRCDKVDSDSIVPFSWSLKKGYHVYCNGYQYGYEIEDVGGRVVVTVK